MLVLNVEGEEFYDEAAEEFKTVPGFSVTLEHSLAALSKWESIHEKPFLGKDEKTSEETYDYVEAMLVSSPAFLPRDWVRRLSNENLEKIHNYMDSKQTATWFSERAPESSKGEIITAELVYHWLIEFQIPFECETWHLNRLFTLIRVRNAKLSKPKKVPRHELAAKRREENERRKAQLGTTG